MRPALRVSARRCSSIHAYSALELEKFHVDLELLPPGIQALTVTCCTVAAPLVRTMWMWLDTEKAHRAPLPGTAGATTLDAGK